MDDFIQRQGPAFLAHLLRRLSDELVQGASAWYPQAGVTAPPRTASTLLALDEHGPLAVMELATLLRQSHPLVIVWIKQLKALGFVETRIDGNDRRRSVLSLTRTGKRRSSACARRSTGWKPLHVNCWTRQAPGSSMHCGGWNRPVAARHSQHDSRNNYSPGSRCQAACTVRSIYGTLTMGSCSRADFRNSAAETSHGAAKSPDKIAAS